MYLTVLYQKLVKLLLKVVIPLTFNDDEHVDAPETNKLVKLVLLFKLLIASIDDVEKLFNIVFVAYTEKSGLFVIAL